MKHIFGKLHYEHHGMAASCRCDILEDADHYTVVFTEAKDNQGVSVTNSIEDIVNAFLEDRGVAPEQCVFLERYESHPHDLDEIRFEWENPVECVQMSGPRWSRLGKKETNAILKWIDSEYSCKGK